MQNIETLLECMRTLYCESCAIIHTARRTKIRNNRANATSRSLY